MSVTTRGFRLVTYAATLDVPRQVVEYLSRLLAAHRRRIGFYQTLSPRLRPLPLLLCPHWPAYPSAVAAAERRIGGVLRKRHEDGAACDNLAWPLAVEGVTRVGHRVNERAFAGG
jgi:hypothetical protein